MAEYQSSEELQRASRDAFIDEAAKKAEEAQQTEKQKVARVLDKYITKHQKSTEIRKMAKEGGRTAEAQLDLSADLVEILTKIKNELGAK